MTNRPPRSHTDPTPDPNDDPTVDYVLDEMSPQQRAAFSDRLTHDPTLRSQISATSRLVQELRSLPQEEVQKDLSSGIFQKVAVEENSVPLTLEPRGGVGFRPVTVKVAAVGLLLLGFVGWLNLDKGRAPSLQSVSAPKAMDVSSEVGYRGMDWLVQNQEPSGAWSGQRWGASSRHRVALTSLALLALSSGDEGISNAKQADAIRRGAGYLMSLQTPDGRIGSEAGMAMHSHALATCALLEVYRLNVRSDLKESLDAALRPLVAVRSTEGGFGYSDIGRNPSRHWPDIALRRAVELGWTYSVPPSSSMDTHRMILAAAGLSHTDIESWKSAAGELVERRQNLDMSRARYSSLGGPVYTTSLSTLALSLSDSTPGSAPY